MNILIISYQGGIAGSTYSISYLAKGLAERGHRVVLGCQKGMLLEQLVEGSGVVVEHMKFKSKLDIQNIKHIKKLVEKHDIDLINSQASKDRYSTIFAKWFAGVNVPLVHTRRQRPMSLGGYLKTLFYIKGADKIVTVSDSLKEIFVQKGYPNDKIKVIYNGIPPSFYEDFDQQKSDNLRQEYLKGLEGKKVIGCVSRLKNQIQLVQVLSLLPEETIVFFVGIEKGTFDKEAVKLGVSDRIIYAGKVNDPVNYYPLFDTNVLASIMDGFGLVLVEAMGMGIPVVGTRAQGIKDVLADGRGLMFEDGNLEELSSKLNEVLYDENIRGKLIQKGRKAAEEIFSLEKTISNYESFFQELITHHKK